MTLLKSFLAIVLFTVCLPLAGQTPAFEDLEFESDSTTASYKPSGKNYVLVRSKRGNSGLTKTPAADAILSAEVTEIVLVFSEVDAADIAEREEANQERWENLLKTYPEFFQFSTTYKNLCQCNSRGDGDAFKLTQGFYIYINGEVPKVAEPKAEAPKSEAPKTDAPKVAANNPPATKAEEKKVEEKKAETKRAEETKAAEKEMPAKDVAVADRTEVKMKEAPPVVKEKEVVKEEEPVATNKSEEKSASTSAPEPVREAPKKKAVAAAKSRRAKDPKACRHACYGNGDDDLNNFFKDNLKLSKKQRRSAKKQTVIVKIQLNVDGTIKKALVTCPDEKLNLLVTEAVKSMNPWNATVKSGVTVKSEVKLTLKYDKPSKSLKAMEVAVMPRLAPKCKCASDSELFD